MKVAIIVPVLMAAFFSASAQTQPLLQIVKEKKQPKKATPPFNYLNKGTAQPQAKLLAVTGTGKIYALPQDNMPCFVPDRSSTLSMPNTSLFVVPGNGIADALPSRPVIPSKLLLEPIALPKWPQLKHKRSNCRGNLICSLPAI